MYVLKRTGKYMEGKATKEVFTVEVSPGVLVEVAAIYDDGLVYVRRDKDGYAAHDSVGKPLPKAKIDEPKITAFVRFNI